MLGTDVDCEGALGNYFGLVKKQPTRAHFHPSSVGTATAQTGLRTALRESWSAKSPGIGQNDLTLFLVPVRTSSLILRQRKVQSSTNTYTIRTLASREKLWIQPPLKPARSVGTHW